MVEVEEIKRNIPAQMRQMGDSPELANRLADLIKRDQNGLLRIFCLLPAGRIRPENREL